MSCTVLAVPYAIAWVVGAFVVGAKETIDSLDYIKDEDNFYRDIQEVDYSKLKQPCDDVHVISENHFIEKSFETIFMDKEILKKTLEEHGIQNIVENEYGQISGSVDSYLLTFEKMEADKPYFVKISCRDSDSAEEKIGDLTSEYTLNVQEESYLNIVNKLKENNMEIEDEEVMDDNTIVLTINLD